MIGRIEYTSCEDGIDGISGFQIRAMTPNIPASLCIAAVRDSVYEPPPAAPSMPSLAELASFPVAFGYTAAPDGIAVYRASYVGRDHTGRWGNYFAQALAADRAEQLPGLPIDLWESPTWRIASTRTGFLESVGPAELVAGDAAGPHATTEFLAASNRLDTLSGLLAATRDVLDGQHGRLVLIVEDSTSAAHWISAVTRSIPKAMAWSLSFTTFTTRPESHQALLTFATPDVTVPTYGNYRTIDLRQPDAMADATLGEYERVVGQLWKWEDPSRLLQSAPVNPPLSPSELDHFVRCAALFETFPVSIMWHEAEVLDSLEFAVRRSPAMLTQPWDRVVGAVRDVGGLQDLPRWSVLLQEASARHAPIPGPLLRQYVQSSVEAIAAGAADSSLWIPSLDLGDQRYLARKVLVPALWYGPSPELLDWLRQPTNSDLRNIALDRLAVLVETTDDFTVAASSLSAGAATAIAELAGGRERLRLAAETSLAGSGAIDPVDVLVRLREAALKTPDEWQLLVSLLWPASPPSPAQAQALLSGLPADRLRRTGLTDDHIVQRLLLDAETRLTRDDFTLATLLTEAAGQDQNLLSEPSRKVAEIVGLVGYFGGRPSYEAAILSARRGILQCQRSTPLALADQYYVALVSWLSGLEWKEHLDALRHVLFPPADAGRLLQFYVSSAEEDLATAKPDRAAILITVWRQLGSITDDGAEDEARRLSDELLEIVLVSGLARASRRHLERIGESKLARRYGGRPDESFQIWWAKWQKRHERRGMLDRLRGPRLGKGD